MLRRPPRSTRTDTLFPYTTLFRSTGGGQPGDSGRLLLASGEIVAITNTIKGDGPDGIIHVPGGDSAALKVGIAGKLEIDWERRHRLMRMHTCLHLLSALVPRSEERRVGKECVSRCSSWWSRYHKNKNKK